MKYSLFLPFILAHSFIPTNRCTFLDRILPEDTVEIKFRQESITAEALAQLEHFRKTGDARASSPTYRITALHAAVLLQDVELVEELLAKGADPNARPLLPNGGGRLIEGAPPILLALERLPVYPRPRLHMMDDMQRIAKKLIEAGADVNARNRGVGVLGQCANHQHTNEPEEWEEIALEYIRWGATATPEDATRLVGCGWDDALEALLKAPGGKQLVQESGSRMLAHAACNEFHAWKPANITSHGVVRCAQMILEANPGCVNEVPEDYDKRPLHLATSWHGRHEMNEQNVVWYAEFVKLLLRHGADAYCSGDEDDQSCPADHMAEQPALLAALAREGIKLPPPPHRLEKEKLYDQLFNMPLAAVSDEEVCEQWDVLASLFEEEPAFKSLSPYEVEDKSLDYCHYSVARTVLQLMDRADAAKAQEFRRTHPACAEVDAWWKAFYERY